MREYCPYCTMALGDHPEEHEIICLRYAHRNDPWWTDLVVVLIECAALVIVVLIGNWIINYWR